MAMVQSVHLYLAHRHREQAPSHIWIFISLEAVGRFRKIHLLPRPLSACFTLST